jgi:hypothetical protein
MRICLVYDCLYPYTVGGAEHWYRNLSERLAEGGHEYTIQIEPQLLDLLRQGVQPAGQIARAVDREAQRSRRRLFQRDQFRQCLGLDPGVDQNDVVALGYHSDRDEILDGIVGELLERIGVHDKGGRSGEQEGISVGRGARDRLRANEVCGAGTVLDDELLPKRSGQLVGDDTTQYIRAVACGLRYHDGHRPLRP